MLLTEHNTMSNTNTSIQSEAEKIDSTFPNDDSDVNDDQDSQYSENFWPKDEEPHGFSYKSKKKAFGKALDNLKLMLKKGTRKDLNKIQITVLDCRKEKSKTSEVDIEIVKSNERGIATLKFYGPNAKKVRTILISKSKNHDAKYVSIAALEIVKPLLEKFLSGEGWNKVLANSSSTDARSIKCTTCEKIFNCEITLKRHQQNCHGKETRIKEDRKQKEKEYTEKLIKGLMGNEENKVEYNAHRLGIFKGGTKRPVKMIFEDAETVDKLLKSDYKMKHLKGDEKLQLGRNLTLKERAKLNIRLKACPDERA